MEHGDDRHWSRLDQRSTTLPGYSRYRQLTFDPIKPIDSRDRLLEKLGAALQSWTSLQEVLLQLPLDAGHLKSEI